MPEKRNPGSSVAYLDFIHHNTEIYIDETKKCPSSFDSTCSMVLNTYQQKQKNTYKKCFNEGFLRTSRPKEASGSKHEIQDLRKKYCFLCFDSIFFFFQSRNQESLLKNFFLEVMQLKEVLVGFRVKSLDSKNLILIPKQRKSNKKWKMDQIFVAFSEYLNFKEKSTYC